MFPVEIMERRSSRLAHRVLLLAVVFGLGSPAVLSAQGDFESYSPDNGSTVNVFRPAFEWEDVGQGFGYQLFVRGDGGSHFQPIYEGPNTRYVPEQDLNEGTYSWYVRAISRGEGAGGFLLSEQWVVTIEELPTPELITPQNEANFAAAETIRFAWSAIQVGAEYIVTVNGEELPPTRKSTLDWDVPFDVETIEWSVTARRGDVNRASDTQVFYVLGPEAFALVQSGDREAPGSGPTVLLGIPRQPEVVAPPPVLKETQRSFRPWSMRLAFEFGIPSLRSNQLYLALLRGSLEGSRRLEGLLDWAELGVKFDFVFSLGQGAQILPNGDEIRYPTDSMWSMVLLGTFRGNWFPFRDDRWEMFGIVGLGGAISSRTYQESTTVPLQTAVSFPDLALQLRAGVGYRFHPDWLLGADLGLSGVFYATQPLIEVNAGISIRFEFGPKPEDDAVDRTGNGEIRVEAETDAETG